MSFHQYLNGVINLPSKYKQVERIKEEIKKMLPLPSFGNQEKQDLNQINRRLLEGKTHGNFYQSPSKKITLTLQKKSIFFSSTHKNFRPLKLDKKQNKPSNLLNQFYQQNSNEEEEEEEEESMREWRQQMMSHIRPKKQTQYKSIQSQSPIKPVNHTQQIVQSKIFKVKTSPSRLKKKKRELSKPTFTQKQSVSQKNIILIKPTPIQEDKTQKILQRNKFQPLKLKKALTNDKFFNCNTVNTNSIKQSDELTLQKIANFQALLPFLGTRKAKVQKKQEKKEALFEIKQSIQQQNKRKKISKTAQIELREQITGWQTSYD